MIDAVLMPDGRVIAAEAFYQARDQRTQATGGTSLSAPVTVALIIGDSALSTAAGQTALIWGASLVRRMGRAYSGVRLVGPPSARGAPYLAALHRALRPRTLGEAIEIELLGADPFAPIEWRDAHDATALAGVDAGIWIGDAPPAGAAPKLGSIHLQARGWVVQISSARAELQHHPAAHGDSPLRLAAGAPPSGASGDAAARAPTPMDAAMAAAVFGASLAAGIVYRWCQIQGQGASVLGLDAPADLVGQKEADRYWLSIDTVAVTTDPSQGAVWWDRGSAADRAAACRGVPSPAPMRSSRPSRTTCCPPIRTPNPTYGPRPPTRSSSP
jgi:hypothetical protein